MSSNQDFIKDICMPNQQPPLDYKKLENTGVIYETCIGL